MSSTRDGPVLGEQILMALGAAQCAVELEPDRAERLRTKVMQALDDTAAEDSGAFETIRFAQGDWREIAPRIEKKRLLLDPASGIETFLLRVQPGASAPGHVHEFDEICLVLEGEVDIGGVHLSVGDYHFAAAGTSHGLATSDTGAVVFIQGGAA